MATCLAASSGEGGLGGDVEDTGGDDVISVASDSSVEIICDGGIGSSLQRNARCAV